MLVVFVDQKLILIMLIKIVKHKQKDKRLIINQFVQNVNLDIMQN